MKKTKTQKLTSDNGALAKSKDFLIAGIGASAGGIQALKEFFENVPADSGVAYVVILHLSPDHESRLAEVLQTTAQIPVTQVKEKVKVEPNHVYVVPPNQHLEMLDGHISVEPNMSVENRRAPVDIFFRTLAESRHAGAIAVVLSGTGADGSMGLKRVKERGGVVFVQNPREAEFSEMPRNSIATELVDQVLNVGEIPAKIVAYRDNLGAVSIQDYPESRPENDQAALREIFAILRVRTGHDFTNYKHPTVLRRIERRINVRELQTLADYAVYMRDDVDESVALLKDLLISVTNFFRDKEAFHLLETEVVPRILQDKSSQNEIRVWVAGCATGEEAYSLAMLFCEQIEHSPVPPKIQIFATDIDEDAIAHAREGFYTLIDAADVSPERLRRFFTKEGDGFRVRRELREMILFAKHNVLKDPPFSHLDLVTCRNLLIYFNGTAQQRAMETFHFALNPGAFMFLGSSESVDGAGDLYAPVNKEFRIYQSRQAAAKVAYPVPDAPPAIRYNEPKPLPPSVTAGIAGASQEQENHLLERISFGDLHQQLLEQYAPPSVVVNENYDIVHISERAGRFLHIAGGEPTKNLLHLVRPELRLELRTALYQAVQSHANVVAANLKVQTNGHAETVNIKVRPVLREEDTARGFLLVLFEPSSGGEDAAEKTRFIQSGEPIARRLEEELERTKSQLRISVEQYEIQTEELRASNEELQAINEELRSTAEELETSREELQSVNEELMTVNQELKIKIEELSVSNNDFKNLLNSTDIGTIFLDRSMRVKMFTPRARDVFNLIDADINRPLADITTKMDFADLHRDVETVLETLHAVEREFETEAGKWYVLRVFPYRTAEDKINGAVVTFFDITSRKAAEDDVRESREKYRTLFNSIDEGFAVFELIFDDGKAVDYRFLETNPAYQAQSGLTNHAGKTIREVLPDIEDFWFETFERVVLTGESVRLEHEVKAINRTFDIYASRVGGADSVKVATVSQDITERKRAEEALRESEERFRAMFEQASIGIVQTSVDGELVAPNPGFCKIIGYAESEAKRLRLRDITHPDDYEREAELTQKLIASEIADYSIEKRYIRKDGSVIWGEMTATLMRDASGKPNFALAVVEDISERKAAEEAGRESEERLRLLVESASDYAIFTMSLDYKIDSWNKGAEKVFGWTESEALGQTGAIIFTSEDRAKGAPEKEIEIALREGRAPDERFHIRKDGSQFYVSGVMTLLKDPDGKVQGFVKIARDMTERLAAEKAVREKEMLQKLVGAQEGERKRIARDLHDELGQQLTALRLKLESARKICDEEEICSKIDEIQLIAKHLDAGIDFLSWELRPAALDDLGLRVALVKYIKEWSHYSGTSAEFIGSEKRKERLLPEVETNLYRITQEALNNVHKHAKAKTVEVSLEKRGKDLIVLIISDDGKGFNPKYKMNRNKGIGLIGMKERAALVGGNLEIESAPGKGTTIYVRVPTRLVKKENSGDE